MSEVYVWERLYCQKGCPTPLIMAVRTQIIPERDGHLPVSSMGPGPAS